MRTNKEKILFLYRNWKMGAHLILRTKRFGVNNKWWSTYDGYFGLPTYKIIINLLLIKPLILNYRLMKFRAVNCYFMNTDEQKCMGWYKGGE